MAQQATPAVAFEEKGFLDRFPWYVQLLALLALVLILGFAIDYYMFAPIRDEAATKMQQVDELKRQNQEADVIRTYIADYEKTLTELNQKFDDLRSRLPEEREVSVVFEDVRRNIKENNLQLIEYNSPSGQENAKTYYTEVPTTAKVAGNYEQIQNLFRQLGNFQRILNVTDIQLKRASDQLQQQRATTEATFQITAFYISDQNRKNIEAELENPGGKDAKKEPAKK